MTLINHLKCKACEVTFRVFIRFHEATVTGSQVLQWYIYLILPSLPTGLMKPDYRSSGKGTGKILPNKVMMGWSNVLPTAVTINMRIS